MKLAIIAVMLAAFEVSAIAAPTAEDLYAQGHDAFDHGDYATAIKDWQLSFKLSGVGGLLFNLGQAYRLAGDCKQALSTFRQFIAIDPQSLVPEAVEQRPLADDFIRELEPTCGARASTPIVDRPTVRPGRNMKVAGLATAGGGLVLFVTGLAFGRHASTLGNEVTSACALPHGCDWDIESGKDADGHRDATIGYTLDVIGVAAILGGAALYYFGSRESEVQIAPLATRMRPDGALVTWSRTW